MQEEEDYSDEEKKCKIEIGAQGNVIGTHENHRAQLVQVQWGSQETRSEIREENA